MEVVDRQRRRRLARGPLVRAARHAYRAAGGPAGPAILTVLLTSDAGLRRLNRAHRGLDRTTDVLSFPADTLDPCGARHLGDIAISVEGASRQARRAGWRLAEVVRRLVIHGVLHLLGHDHETDRGQMMRLQGRVLRALGRTGTR